MLHTLPILLSLLAQVAPSAAADANKERAQTLLKEGSALYKQADYAAALEKFQAAYSLYPSPKLQFNIAQADRELGRLVESVEAFETFLVQAPDSAPEILAQARQSLTELKPRLAQLRIDAIAGAQVTVDERALGFTPLTRIVWVLPGGHSVAIKHPDYLPVSLSVTVAAGDMRTVAPQLLRPGVVVVAAPPPAPAPPPTTVVAPAPPAPAPAASAAPRKPWYLWTAGAATVAFTGAAMITGLSANGKYHDLENGCGMSGGCTDSQIDGVKSRARLANVFWILAGVSAAATGVSFYMYADHRETGASVALRF